MSDDPQPVELVETHEEVSPVDRGLDEHRLHAWIRSGAAIVVAACALWVGTSAMSIRDAERREVCFSELQTAVFAPGPRMSPEQIGGRLVERAEECGLPLTAESIRNRYVDE